MKRIAAIAVAFILVAAATPDPFHRRLPEGVAPPAIPADNPISDARIALGRRLFYDADLSVDGTMACATCHEQRRGFADGNATHAGVHGDPGRRNVPGLANVAWRRSLTWGDPRVTTLEAQVPIPLTGQSPVEMGMAGKEVELRRRLRRDACYRTMFRAAFPETRGRIDQAAVAKALAAFQRTFVSFDAPIDRGEAPAAGAAIFAAKCATCHAGHDFTDDRFHRLRPSAPADRGLGEVTGRVGDDGAFRTPSLRNVGVTGPWLHDGSAATLDQALMAHPDADPADTPALIAFLAALTDDAFLANPALGYPDDICRR
ncbi:cytochrome-c peroxidase [Sphingomonas sp. AP4-R1]|uniref:cytochrome-c peroxidase n=1 Tax=Sphingomonas sp. AP4-R1 TaxID=2735134 RepID=UPI00149343D2|nr:cytochrome-c peroxidase [Sphingomonas sp. AP4-R1]QJU58139.1 cytochrome-c peroxidase [Sphingomonas sp. AP4-R1]